MLHPEVARRMSAIQAQVRARGIPFNITSTVRTTTKQAAMYSAWVKGGRKGLPVARPGLSTHEYGIAFDASFPVARTAEVATIARSNAMVHFGPGDRVHFDIFGPTRWNAILKAAGLL